MDNTSFKLTAAVVPFTVEDSTGQVEMELREMSAAQRDQYLDSLSSRMRMDAAGRPAGIKKFEGLQSGLLARCLRRKDGKQVTEKEIQEWPASVVSNLFKMAQEQNHLSGLEDEVAKKD